MGSRTAAYYRRSSRTKARSRRRRLWREGRRPRRTRGSLTWAGHEPGKQATRAGACARSSKEEWEAEVHGSAAPRKHRPTPNELSQPEETGGARGGWDDVGRVWTRPGGTAIRPAWTNPSRSISSAAVAKSLDSVVPRTSKGGAELEMEVGPLRSAYRGGSQTAGCC